MKNGTPIRIYTSGRRLVVSTTLVNFCSDPTYTKFADFAATLPLIHGVAAMWQQVAAKFKKQPKNNKNNYKKAWKTEKYFVSLYAETAY